MTWGRIAYEIAQQNPDVQIQEPQSRKKRPPVVPTEHEEQVAVFQWARDNEQHHPELKWLFAVPNGGHRHPAVAARLKGEGVKAGVPDIFLPIARHGFHGLVIELKRNDHSNHTTPEQDEWIATLTAEGYDVVVAYGADAAIEAIEEYLSL